MQSILAEKDNYISKLENELEDLRKENEKVKDKLIVFELDKLGGTSNIKKGNTMYSNSNINERTLADSHLSGKQNTNMFSLRQYEQHNLGRTHSGYFTGEAKTNVVQSPSPDPYASRGHREEITLSSSKFGHYLENGGGTNDTSDANIEQYNKKRMVPLR